MFSKQFGVEHWANIWQYVAKDLFQANKLNTQFFFACALLNDVSSGRRFDFFSSLLPKVFLTLIAYSWMA